MCMGVSCIDTLNMTKNSKRSISVKSCLNLGLHKSTNGRCSILYFVGYLPFEKWANMCGENVNIRCEWLRAIREAYSA